MTEIKPLQNLHLCHGNVLLERLSDEDVSEGGIILPRVAQETHGMQYKMVPMRVLKACPYFWIGESRLATDLKEGDIVVVNEIMLAQMTYRGRVYSTINACHIFGSEV